MSSTATLSGSDQSKNRTLGGILVHVLAPFTIFIGPVIMYAISDHEFMRKNARNVLNWHATLVILWAFGLIMMSLAIFFAGGDVTLNEEPIDPLPVPSSIEAVFTFITIFLQHAMAVTVLATFVYAIVGTLKAMSGSVWSYPGAIDIVGRLR